MARLTPLSKALVAVIVIGAAGSAAWNLALKDMDLGKLPASISDIVRKQMGKAESVPAPTASPAPAPAVPATPAPSATPAPTPAPKAADPAPSSGRSAEALVEEGRRLAAAGDFVRARKPLEEAVQLGNGAAACMLGDLVMKGQGGAADPARAGELFRIAQAKGSLCFGN